MALIVCNSFFMDRVMKVLEENGIDYFTSWDNAAARATAPSRTWARAATAARTR